MSASRPDAPSTLWAGTAGGLSSFRRGAFASLTTEHGLPHDSIWSLADDRDGNLWVGTGGGLTRFAGGRFTTAPAGELMPSDKIRTTRT